VLVVEDDPVAAKILCTLVEQTGYEPLLAPNGREAWELFDQDQVRLIISDWTMPGLDGLGLCGKVRSRAKTLYTYFILLTANETSASNYALASASGVDDFIMKPLDRELIRMRLRVAERILEFTTEIRQLKGYITMCVYCRKIRDDDDDWEPVETYIEKETRSEFTHGSCPACTEKAMQRFRG
jgi:sigma-B regulation protein RsbU (phosphoserine phosphatase)